MKRCRIKIEKVAGLYKMLVNGVRVYPRGSHGAGRSDRGDWLHKKEARAFGKTMCRFVG